MSEYALCIKCKVNHSQHGSGICPTCRTCECARCKKSYKIGMNNRSGFCKRCAGIKNKELNGYLSLEKVFSFEDHVIAS